MTGGGYYPHERSTSEPSFNAYAIDGSLVSNRLMCQHQHAAAAAAARVRSHENDLDQRMGVLDQSSSLFYSEKKLSHQNSRWSFIVTIYPICVTKPKPSCMKVYSPIEIEIAIEIVVIEIHLETQQRQREREREQGSPTIMNEDV